MISWDQNEVKRNKMKRKNNLRRIRLYRDITQDELGILTGYDQSLISRLERGVLLKTPRTEKMKEKVSSVFGFPLNKVFPEG